MSQSLLAQLAHKYGPRGLHDALTPKQRQIMKYCWEANARPLSRLPSGEYVGQMEPPGNWRTWLCMAGRGWGKTRTLNEWVRSKAKKHPGCRIAIIGATASEARKITGEGESGLINICPPWERPHFNVTNQVYEFPNKSLAFLYSAEKPSLFRGPQFHFVASDELAKWRRLGECIYNIQFGLRLPVKGGRAQWMISTTPQPLQTLRDIRRKQNTVVTIGTSFDNVANLDAETIEEWNAWRHTTIGRQELFGELFDEVVGAVYKRSWIQQIAEKDIPPLDRIGVGVDPAETETGNDDTGIIIAGMSGSGIRSTGYVLDDRTIHGSPDAAANAVVRAYMDWNASFVKVDGNRNGQLFNAIIKMAAERIGTHVNVLPVKGGNWGKRAWASPIASIYEQGRIFHVNRYVPGTDIPVTRELEEEMCTWTEERQGQRECGSPDRMDASSYVFSELFMKRPPRQEGLNERKSLGRRI